MLLFSDVFQNSGSPRICHLALGDVKLVQLKQPCSEGYMHTCFSPTVQTYLFIFPSALPLPFSKSPSGSLLCYTLSLSLGYILKMEVWWVNTIYSLKCSYGELSLHHDQDIEHMECNNSMRAVADFRIS